MSTIQMIGIGIAVGILIILVIALIITRRRDAAGGGKTKEKKEAKKEAKQPQVPPADLTPETASFLEGAPRDDLHMLRGEKAPDAPAEGVATAATTAGAAAAVATSVAGSEERQAPDLWAEHHTESSSRAAPTDLWGSAAASADAEAAATVGTAEGAVPETAVEAAPETAAAVEGTPDAAAVVEDAPVAGAALPMFAAQEDAGIESPVGEEAAPAAETPVVPFSTEPPPPWEQQAAASGPTGPVQLEQTAAEPWRDAGVGAAAGEPQAGEPDARPAGEMPGTGPGTADERVVVAPWVIDPDHPATATAAEAAEAPAAIGQAAGGAAAVRPFAEAAERPFAESAERPFAGTAEETPPAGPTAEPPAADTAVRPFAPEAAAEAPAPAASVAEPTANPAGPAVEAGVGDQAPVAAADAPGVQTPVTGAEPVAERRPPKLVALSGIISTTNQQMVDLNDPDVRRMLKELAKSEIDLAQQYKSLGQNIDAVLQLTEARKICESLDMASHAKLIDQMIQEVQP
jgi:hypothetical protein